MSARAPLVSIIIPAFNNWPLTHRALSSLAEYTPNRIFELIVVDNNSSDDTPYEAPVLGRQLFGDAFTFLRQETNLNFGPACNLGALHAKAEFLFFLNNDVELIPNWWSPLLQAARDTRRLGGLGPLLLYPDTQTVQHAGIAFDPTLAPVHLYADFPADHPTVQRGKNLQALSAAALFIPRTIFIDVGGFFPEYRNGYEDLDLCARLRRTNHNLTIVPQSRIVHHESVSPGRFESEHHNICLLTERCSGDFFPDLHRHGYTDGFRPALTEWGAFTLTDPLPAEKIPTSLGPLTTELERHPLSGTLHDTLVDQFLTAGNLQQGQNALVRACRLCPSLERYKRLDALAQDNAPGLFAHIHARLMHVQSILTAKNDLLKRVQGLANWAQHAGEVELAQLYLGFANTP
ncbi:glycosyltransferase family 2 protein [Desulfovibrio inopinatus]|uniref:glycosyltransferase family 2 protein n=1 Tax=Desulfovibrio inopinatus TaxID=102109 RepID=UPI00047F8DEB|nr:glycosyltransferase family 2 protein [Desulfovibrio inopinatus]